MCNGSEDIRNFLAHLTSEPGVYRMLDATATVLYVGKAKNLKKRVSSYFTQKNTTAKTRSLVSQIVSIDVSVTRTETEALLLESSLIKSLRPKYNVLLRDDKSYPWIYVNTNHPWPRMEIIRSKKKPQKGLYFGPYPSNHAVHETINIIQKLFKIRNCRDSYFSNRSRPCLQYQIQRCTAPCTEYISREAYQQSVHDALSFLQGKSQQIIKELMKRMNHASEQLDFEQAAILRDQIKSLRHIQEQQGVTQRHGNADILAIEGRVGFACVQCVTVRDGHVIASQSFFPVLPPVEAFATDYEQSLPQQILEAFIAFYYMDMPERIPPLIILDKSISDTGVIERLLAELSGRACCIQINPRGTKAKWLDFAQNNLRLAITKYVASKATIHKRYQALADLLQLDKSIERMECFDISHTQGDATVASCVVFGPEGPLKKEYRRFTISGITPGDDYAAMEQALTRRFKRLQVDGNYPDILVIDGGKGQVGVAQRVLEALSVSLSCVTLLGIAKGPDRRAGWERLILVSQGREITLPEESEALHLLQHIRDEAHRFAITTHRKKRQKASFDSSLQDIEGIGPKKRQALLHYFGGMRELVNAPIADIAKVTGISRELAIRIFEHCHPS